MAHDRTADHYGVEDTTTAVLAADIGRYAAGLTVQDVLTDLVARLEQVEQAGSGTLFFAVVARSIVQKTINDAVNADAWINLAGSFSADAVLLAGITANAVIIEDVTC